MFAGIQISSLKPYLQTQADMRLTMERVAKMGYRYTQLQWISMEIPICAIADALAENGLIALGTQEKFDACADTFDYYIQLNRACRCDDLCMSGIPTRFNDSESMKSYISAVKGYAARAADAGLHLSYHPVANDFRCIGTTPAAAILIDALPDLLLVPDTNQLLRAQVDVPAWIRNHAGRIRMIHFKDMENVAAGAKLKPVGQGCTDFPSIVHACRDAGVQYLLTEQETWEKDAFQCMRESLEYIRSCL